MKKVFLAFGLLLTVSIATTLFSACGEKEKESKTPAQEWSEDAILADKVTVADKVVTLKEKVSIPAGATLSIPAGVTLVVSTGKSLIVQGILKFEEGGSLVVSEYAALAVRTGGRIYRGDTQSAAGLTATASASTTKYMIDKGTNYYLFYVTPTTSGNTSKAVIGNLGITRPASGLTATLSNETPQHSPDAIQTGTGISLTFKW